MGKRKLGDWMRVVKTRNGVSFACFVNARVMLRDGTTKCSVCRKRIAPRAKFIAAKTDKGERPDFCSMDCCRAYAMQRVPTS